MDSRIDSMKKQIRTATAFGLAVYLLAFLYLLIPQWIIDNLDKARGWLSILSIAVLGLASYFVMGNLHGFFDNRFFRGRELVNACIREELTKPCREVMCERAVKRGILDKEKDDIINLFYTFVQPDDTERERSFSYFTQYYIAINLGVLSLLGLVGAVVTASLVPLLRWDQRLVFLLLALVLPVIMNGLRYTSRRRLIAPTKAQTMRILVDHSDDLKTKLPAYRAYDSNVSCRDSGQCPFLTGAS
jgi:hypothetical protein